MAMPVGVAKHMRHHILQRELVGTHDHRIAPALVPHAVDARKVRVVRDVVQELVQVDGAHFQVCGNGEKVLVHTADARAFVDPAKDQKIEDKISIAGLNATIDPRDEWNQILTDAGRLVRDYFYQDDTHHVDWTAVVKRYKGALPDCTSREDVDFLIREMLGELNCGHTYTDSPPDMDDSKPASPVGARW